MMNIAVIGSSGALGKAFIRQLANIHTHSTIHAFSRYLPKQHVANVIYNRMDYQSEESIEKSALIAAKDSPLDRVIVTSGILHEENLMPEKSLKDLSREKFLRLFQVNTILPAIVAKYFLPQLNKTNTSVFAVLSARVGSISDNHLGGWYAYRASKAALNMVVKNAAIETGRLNKKAIVVGLHPGTVDSNLSRPFKANIPDRQLFTPEYAVQKLLDVLDSLTPQQSGKFWGWDGHEIKP